MNASASTLYLLDAGYHGALRFTTGSKPLTHHCKLYFGLMSKSIDFYIGKYLLNINSLPGSIIFVLLHDINSTIAAITLRLSSPTAFHESSLSWVRRRPHTPSSWNTFQQDQKLSSIPSRNVIFL